jgi:hypothetical protein
MELSGCGRCGGVGGMQPQRYLELHTHACGNVLLEKYYGCIGYAGVVAGVLCN